MDPPDSKLFPAISMVSKRPPILSEASNTSIVASGPKSSRRKCDELEPPIPAPMTAMFIGFDLRSAANTDRCLAKKRVGSKKMLVLTPKPNARNIFFLCKGSNEEWPPSLRTLACDCELTWRASLRD